MISMVKIDCFSYIDVDSRDMKIQASEKLDNSLGFEILLADFMDNYINELFVNFHGIVAIKVTTPGG